jgi:hypothetical protein
MDEFPSTDSSKKRSVRIQRMGCNIISEFWEISQKFWVLYRIVSPQIPLLSSCKSDDGIDEICEKSFALVLVISHFNLDEQEDPCRSMDEHSILFHFSLKSSELHLITMQIPDSSSFSSEDPGDKKYRPRWNCFVGWQSRLAVVLSTGGVLTAHDNISCRVPCVNDSKSWRRCLSDLSKQIGRVKTGLCQDKLHYHDESQFIFPEIDTL